MTAYLPTDGALVGGTSTMIEAVRTLRDLGASFEEAVGAATDVPARVLGIRSGGRLAAGLPADVVVLTDELEIERVLVAGKDRLS